MRTTFRSFASQSFIAAPAEDLPDNLLDLPEVDRDKKLEAANQALEAASLAFTHAALR